MHLVVGLGNPGKEYAATRHNIGFMLLDRLAADHQLAFKRSKWQAEVAKGNLWGKPVLLVKPQTYMNLSGLAVGGMARFYQAENSRIIVIHDDLDLPLGRVKVVVKRGAGGHNGIRSLVEHLGGNDFIRLRAGIGRPNGGGVSDFVLSRFAGEEDGMLAEGLDLLQESLRLVLTEGLNVAMNRINSGRLGSDA